MMTLAQFKTLLAQNTGKAFQLLLPTGDAVPQSFHITEVGLVNKTFLDCGGTLRRTSACQLQAWVGDDEDHRLAAGKLTGILNKAASFLIDTDVPVEIEYEDGVLSQYPVSNAEVTDSSVVLHLESKHTDCLAKDVCLPKQPAEASSCGCGPRGCC